eukprot:gnl/TRDRNA2_/TRDRNA2_91585_c1_seq2.p1 gnl/TRDRNA2_/TRDRNA2_91585_c1~~gnl/TRDRNA2_/TRDRNA2_91585_c1_seq2.p1  ORF type:complete len:147 (+),score=8.09 gnl/TRDRNA2_/TRDRNA2_91585_c1_seq2:276-716(+)
MRILMTACVEGQRIRWRRMTRNCIFLYYPETFEEDCVGKSKRYQTIPQIPFVDMEEVQRLTSKKELRQLNVELPRQNAKLFVKTGVPRKGRMPRFRLSAFKPHDICVDSLFSALLALVFIVAVVTSRKICSSRKFSSRPREPLVWM